jgi:hypothetical protein
VGHEVSRGEARVALQGRAKHQAGAVVDGSLYGMRCWKAQHHPGRMLRPYSEIPRSEVYRKTTWTEYKQ